MLNRRTTMAKDTPTTAHPDDAYIPAERKDIAQLLALGLAAGALVVLLGEALQRFFINPVFCGNAASGSTCGPDGVIGFYVSTVIVAILSVVALVRFGIFRPLLIAVGAAVALWGIKSYMTGLSLLEYGFWVAVLYALTYVLLYWLLRARHFVLSLVLVVIAVVALRLVLLV